MSPTGTTAPLIFDGHNDTLLNLHSQERGGGRSFFERSDKGHIDLPRAREGGLGGGFCAIFVPSERMPQPDPDDTEKTSQAALAAFSGDRPMPPTPELGKAQPTAIAMMALLFRLEEESRGQVKVVRTADELAACLRDGVFAALLHFEGAEAIDPGLDALEVFYRAGLRSIGPVWSRPNAFAHGVPFKFPHSPDTGPGLTDAGKELVRACNRLGILLDLSHLNERGFWDVAELSDAPLVATHTAAHAICPSTRNLTDKQLDAIRESRGIVGLNFEVSSIRADAWDEPNTPLSVLVDQIDYLVARLGIDHVGFGSDFDGATMPREIGDAAGFPNLIHALRDRGYDGPRPRKLAHENWLRVLGTTWRG